MKAQREHKKIFVVVPISIQETNAKLCSKNCPWKFMIPLVPGEATSIDYPALCALFLTTRRTSRLLQMGTPDGDIARCKQCIIAQGAARAGGSPSRGQGA